MLDTQQTEGDRKGSDEEEEGDNDDDGGQDDEKNKTLGEFAKKRGGEEVVEQRFEISQYDRLMRTRDRYLVNPAKHPGYQIEDVKKTVI